MTDDPFSIEDFPMLAQPLIGMRVSLPWKGYGTAIFLELGELTPSGTGRHAEGEAYISAEWDWRVERDRRVVFGSSNRKPRIERGLTLLQGATVEGVAVTGDVPELLVSFSGGLALRTTAMVTGDPQWSIKLRDGLWVYPRAGSLWLGEGGESASEEERRVFALAERTAKRWGKPVAQPTRGECRTCAWFVWLDGEGSLLDYGACSSSESPFDGKVVNCTSGCPSHAGNALGTEAV